MSVSFESGPAYQSVAIMIQNRTIGTPKLHMRWSNLIRTFAHLNLVQDKHT